jgi:ABC-type branched-subunit amino acid transport system substrate-binding protein
LGAGFEAGLQSRAAPGRPPLECVRVSTRSETPEEFAAAIDSAAAFAGALCGGVSPGSALLAAAAARWRAIPLVCLAPGDPAAVRLSNRAFGLGPTGAQRGRALAGAIAPGKKDRVALIVSSAADTAFASGFVASCRERGAAVVGRVVYAPGNASFTSEIRGLIGQHATVLFWDGDPPEAAALLRQLTRDRVALRICGGDGLDPARHHKESRVFLEGVTYATDDWGLGADEQARLDARLGAAGPSDDRHVRGYLAGRLVGAAIASGALTREELAAALARLATGNGAALDVSGQGGVLPVFSVEAAEPKRVQ